MRSEPKMNHGDSGNKLPNFHLEPYLNQKVFRNDCFMNRGCPTAPANSVISQEARDQSLATPQGNRLIGFELTTRRSSAYPLVYDTPPLE